MKPKRVVVRIGGAQGGLVGKNEDQTRREQQMRLGSKVAIRGQPASRETANKRRRQLNRSLPDQQPRRAVKGPPPASRPMSHIYHPSNEDQQRGAVYVCSGCRQPIRDRYLLSACNKYWHDSCLKCDRCQAKLGELGSTLYESSNMNLCRQDYFEMFGQKAICAICDKLIYASEMVMRARENVYHLECFACQLCGLRFCVGDRFHLCENKIVCQYDYDEHIYPIQESIFDQQRHQQHQQQHLNQLYHVALPVEQVTPDTNMIRAPDPPLGLESTLRMDQKTPENENDTDQTTDRILAPSETIAESSSHTLEAFMDFAGVGTTTTVTTTATNIGPDEQQTVALCQEVACPDSSIELTNLEPVESHARPAVVVDLARLDREEEAEVASGAQDTKPDEGPD